MVLADSYGISRAPYYSGALYNSANHFTYVAITRYGPTSQLCSVITNFSNCCLNNQIQTERPTTPTAQRLIAITCNKFRLFPVRSPLLGESLF
jgi:hypothetical protein